MTNLLPTIKLLIEIHKQLPTDNKFGKSIIYLMGEIFLVLIGILITFQVNSWNGERKRDLLDIVIL